MLLRSNCSDAARHTLRPAPAISAVQAAGRLSRLSRQHAPGRPKCKRRLPHPFRLQPPNPRQPFRRRSLPRHAGSSSPAHRLCLLLRHRSRPHRAVVQYENGLLTVRASNSSLNQILRAIMRQTGLQINGGVTDERVYGVYGPARLQPLLARLFDGVNSDVLYISASGGPACPAHPDAAGWRIPLLPRPASRRSDDLLPDPDTVPPVVCAAPVPVPQPQPAVATQPAAALPSRSGAAAGSSHSGTGAVACHRANTCSGNRICAPPAAARRARTLGIRRRISYSRSCSYAQRSNRCSRTHNLPQQRLQQARRPQLRLLQRQSKRRWHAAHASAAQFNCVRFRSVSCPPTAVCRAAVVATAL